MKVWLVGHYDNGPHEIEVCKTREKAIDVLNQDYRNTFFYDVTEAELERSGYFIIEMEVQ